LPFTSPSQYRPTSNMLSTSEPTPEFLAHLTSMDSSASEADPQDSQSMQLSELLVKPASSAADSGTFTCTYYGCTQRFETLQKLQKHKREGHQNANPASMGASGASQVRAHQPLRTPGFRKGWAGEMGYEPAQRGVSSSHLNEYSLISFAKNM
jgi:hypothetical protein